MFIMYQTDYKNHHFEISEQLTALICIGGENEYTIQQNTLSKIFYMEASYWPFISCWW